MQSFFQLDQRLAYRKLWLFVAVMLLVLILYLSMTSKPYLPTPGHSDKLYHFLAYMVLMGWWLQLFQQRISRLILALVFIAMGVGIEVMQSYHPLRYFDVWDMLANTSGVVLAWLLGFTVFDQALYFVERRCLVWLR